MQSAQGSVVPLNLLFRLPDGGQLRFKVLNGGVVRQLQLLESCKQLQLLLPAWALGMCRRLCQLQSVHRALKAINGLAQCVHLSLQGLESLLGCT